MANFDISYDITMSHEGKVSNNPKDRGGLTYKGIAYNFHPNWPGWKIIHLFKQDSPDFKKRVEAASNQLEPLVREFYAAEFFNSMQLDKVKNQSIANELFDTAVNMGKVPAISDLQMSLNVLNRNQKSYKDIDNDGKIGPATLTMLNIHPEPKKIFNCLNGFQFMRYVKICERDPTQEEFFNGWLNRVVMM